MNVALRRGMTSAEFLDWEDRPEGRWEFDGFEPVARVGGTVFERRGAEWVGSLVTDAAAVLLLPEVGVELPLAELYEGVLD